MISALYVPTPAILTFNKSGFVRIIPSTPAFAPIRYPLITCTGGIAGSVNPSKKMCSWSTDAAKVLVTSIASHSTEIFFWNWLSGGIIWVIYPLLSLANEESLNPFAFRDTEPKLEFELVIDISPPLSLVKCSEKPTANTETAWTNALLDALIWEFLYVGLYREDPFK